MLFDQSFNDTYNSGEGPLFEKTNSDFNPYYENRNAPPTIDIYIGLKDNERSAGFEGSIRQVQMIGTYLDSIQKIKNAAFTYLLHAVEPSLFFQTTLFNTTSGLLDSVSEIMGSTLGSNI